MAKKDKFKEFGCEFKNEAECEEELDAESLNMQQVEQEHFDEIEKQRNSDITKRDEEKFLELKKKTSKEKAADLLNEDTEKEFIAKESKKPSKD